MKNSLTFESWKVHSQEDLNPAVDVSVECAHRIVHFKERFKAFVEDLGLDWTLVFFDEDILTSDSTEKVFLIKMVVMGSHLRNSFESVFERFLSKIKSEEFSRSSKNAKSLILNYETTLSDKTLEFPEKLITEMELTGAFLPQKEIAKNCFESCERSIRQGNFSKLKCFCNDWVNMDEINAQGQRLFDMAMESKRVDMLYFLLEKGADDAVYTELKRRGVDLSVAVDGDKKSEELFEEIRSLQHLSQNA